MAHLRISFRLKKVVSCWTMNVDSSQQIVQQSKKRDTHRHKKRFLPDNPRAAARWTRPICYPWPSSDAYRRRASMQQDGVDATWSTKWVGQLRKSHRATILKWVCLFYLSTVVLPFIDKLTNQFAGTPVVTKGTERRLCTGYERQRRPRRSFHDHLVTLGNFEKLFQYFNPINEKNALCSPSKPRWSSKFLHFLVFTCHTCICITETGEDADQ